MLPSGHESSCSSLTDSQSNPSSSAIFIIVWASAIDLIASTYNAIRPRKFMKLLVLLSEKRKATQLSYRYYCSANGCGKEVWLGDECGSVTTKTSPKYSFTYQAVSHCKSFINQSGKFYPSSRFASQDSSEIGDVLEVLYASIWKNERTNLSKKWLPTFSSTIWKRKVFQAVNVVAVSEFGDLKLTRLHYGQHADFLLHTRRQRSQE